MVFDLEHVLAQHFHRYLPLANLEFGLQLERCDLFVELFQRVLVLVHAVPLAPKVRAELAFAHE